jgi:hypothetical protein
VLRKKKEEDEERSKKKKVKKKRKKGAGRGAKPRDKSCVFYRERIGKWREEPNKG